MRRWPFVVLILILAGGGFWWWATEQNQSDPIDIFTPGFQNRTAPTGEPVTVIPLETLVEQAEALTHQARFGLATETIQQILTREPKNETAYRLLLEIHTHTANAQQLAATAQRVENLFGPDHPMTDTSQVYMALLQRDYTRVLTFISSVPDPSPSLVFTHAILRSLQNDHEQAQALLTTLDGTEKEVQAQALRALYEEFDTVTDGQDPHLYALLAKELTVQGELTLAREVIDTALKEDQEYIDAWIVRGFLFLQMGEYEFAVQDLSRAYGMDDLRPRTAYLLGVAHEQNGNQTKAMELYERAIQNGLSPAADALISLSNLYAEAGQFDRLISLYESALPQLQADNDSLGTLQSLIPLFSSPEQVLPLTRAFTQANPQNVSGLNLHAWALIAQDELESADLTLEKARTLAPNNPQTWLYTGLVREEQNRPEEAQAAYQYTHQVASEQGDSATAQLALSRYEKLAR